MNRCPLFLFLAANLQIASSFLSRSLAPQSPIWRLKDGVFAAKSRHQNVFFFLFQALRRSSGGANEEKKRYKKKKKNLYITCLSVSYRNIVMPVLRHRFYGNSTGECFNDIDQHLDITYLNQCGECSVPSAHGSTMKLLTYGSGM
ncbi:hypothetical protein GGR50DRAFT_667482 [Xylaria sp. CBS 124048]|nr:hypothetical protein GGR50DRAFT_667482 [Xylaria sp. CBS 124048]